jgi:hypothetical protein
MLKIGQKMCLDILKYIPQANQVALLTQLREENGANLPKFQTFRWDPQKWAESRAADVPSRPEIKSIGYRPVTTILAHNQRQLKSPLSCLCPSCYWTAGHSVAAAAKRPDRADTRLRMTATHEQQLVLISPYFLFWAGLRSSLFISVSMKREVWCTRLYYFTCDKCTVIEENVFMLRWRWPPLWSSGQSSWLRIQRSLVRLPALPDFLRSSGSGTGSTQPQLSSCLEEIVKAPVKKTVGNPLPWPRDTLYPQKLALISPRSGDRSVSIFRSRTKATEFVLCCVTWRNKIC